jgi:hypothetical protein
LQAAQDLLDSLRHLEQRSARAHELAENLLCELFYSTKALKPQEGTGIGRGDSKEVKLRLQLGDIA